MRLNKDNCHANCYDTLGTAILEANTWDSSFLKARVIEVPKIWRENGKQYIVDFVTIAVYSELKYTVKAPRGCTVNSSGAYKIEYYD